MERKIFKLDDAVLAQVVRLVQLGFLTQTDIVDHMRQIKLEESSLRPGNLVLTPEYVMYDKEVVNKLLEEADTLASQQEQGTEQN